MNDTTLVGRRGSFILAERVGFEPTVAQRTTTVFETAPFNRSGTSPPPIIPPLDHAPNSTDVVSTPAGHGM